MINKGLNTHWVFLTWNRNSAKCSVANILAHSAVLPVWGPHTDRPTHTHTRTHTLAMYPQSDRADILKHESSPARPCSTLPRLHLGNARSNTTSDCDRQLLRLRCHLLRTKINRGPWSASIQMRGVQNRPGRSLFGRWKWCVNVHAEQIWAFALIVSLIFADVLPPGLEPASLPHLFSFHQQDFKAHFVASATVPPFLPPPSPPLASPAPTKSHSWRWNH